MQTQTLKLTKRELEVLAYKALGMTSKQVADVLYISKRTVDFHMTSLLDKTNAHNLIGVMAAVRQAGYTV